MPFLMRCPILGNVTGLSATWKRRVFFASAKKKDFLKGANILKGYNKMEGIMNVLPDPGHGCSFYGCLFVLAFGWNSSHCWFFSAAQSPKTYRRVLGWPIKKERKKISFGLALSEKSQNRMSRKKPFKTRATNSGQFILIHIVSQLTLFVGDLQKLTRQKQAIVAGKNSRPCIYSVLGHGRNWVMLSYCLPIDLLGKMWKHFTFWVTC